MVLYWQGFLQPPEHGRCSHSMHDVWQHGPVRVCIPVYGPMTGRRWRHSDRCARCRGQCQDAEPQPHGLRRHPFSKHTQRWAVKTASRHCEVPEPREDPLVGKEKSEPLRPLRSRQEYRVYPMTTVYLPTERREIARMWLPTWTSATPPSRAGLTTRLTRLQPRALTAARGPNF